ncbi:helix-turn-helix domain-containing protein [Streptomyces kaniharaensis]|nr:helix-turn-helix domain-containing protein [Streptomyces kaniharaensis]
MLAWRFGCARVVYNDALAARKEAGRPGSRTPGARISRSW